MNRKGQEEITGFAIVVVVVAVLGLVLLVLAIKTAPSSVSTDNYYVRQFLDSSMKVSSECTLRSNIDYAELREIVQECSGAPSKECGNGKKVCDELNTVFSEIIERGLKVGPDRPYKGFNVNVTFESENGNIESITSFYGGNCTGNRVGGEYLVRDDVRDGNVVVTLMLCS